jgi:hypothetical protein
MPKRLDLTGREFGLIKAMKFSHSQNGSTWWWFKCDCGTEFTRPAKDVVAAEKKGKKQSCGCYSLALRIAVGHANKTHGVSHHKLYDVHRQMLQRCFNDECKDYPFYGGRGITVCQDWMDVHSFMKWCTGSGYADGLTIERQQVNGNYEPGNCTWIPNKEQARNTRRLRNITVHGKTKFMSDRARESGVNFSTIRSRLNNGWSDEDAILTPIGSPRGAR